MQGFSFKDVVNQMGSTPSFDIFLEKLETFHGRQVSSIADLKARDNKKLKGDVWEFFCQRYLLASGKYGSVWLWNEVPDEVRTSLGLVSRIDNGIDIIASNKRGTGYIAVQCKYRKKVNSTVSWTTLSTFVGLCAVTGPYDRHLVMTNCRGVSRKVPRCAKDWSICYGTFKGMKREMWLKIGDNFIEHSFDSPEEFCSETLTIEELRARRLARLGFS